MGKIIYLAAIQEKKEGGVLPELMIEDKRGYEDMPQNAEDILALYANNQYPVPVIGIAKKFGLKFLIRICRIISCRGLLL